MGTSRLCPAVRWHTKDHPHACGDKKPVQAELRLYQGSSPRVWGQVKKGVCVVREFGIIPTRVGTSKVLVQQDFAAWDHPHACGDKAIQTNGTFYPNGSSPRVWGQVKFVPDRFHFFRIIPTRVGTRKIP